MCAVHNWEMKLQVQKKRVFWKHLNSRKTCVSVTEGRPQGTNCC